MARREGGELRRADQRAMLMERMFEIVTESGDKEMSPALERDLRAAFQRCFRCHQAGFCGRWLDGREPDADYRTFCPNATLFERLRGCD